LKDFENYKDCKIARLQDYKDLLLQIYKVNWFNKDGFC